MDNKSSLFNSAGKAGLILGGLSTAHLAASDLLSSIQGAAGIITGLLSFVLWGAKFAFCIILMKKLMQKYANTLEEPSQREVFRFGRLSALLSSALFSAATMAYQLFIRPDAARQAFEALKGSPAMTKEAMQMMESLLPQLPTFTFFVNLIYCFLFGLILSSIFSRNIVSNNPFSEQK